ncbi:MAG: glycoside hydrolase family 88 protein [Proteobacteria bacterium]|jgi:unsaturated rhamnogalacturonyl hydrolase|nr:glycoside hydrolase family 88 protein [Pseudomonadota bacterium]MDA1290817.1 glycoside hydrolase family 88 protein [Pseudomonadota bacterium]
MKLTSHTILLSALLLFSAESDAQISQLDVGLTAEREVILAFSVAAKSASAPRVLVIAGIDGTSPASQQVQSLVTQYGERDAATRDVNLLAIPIANPGAEISVFPPQGDAYGENPVAHALWRWTGVHAPDIVVIVGDDSARFGEAVSTLAVAGVGSIPVQTYSDISALGSQLTEFSDLDYSPARREVERRLSRSPSELAEQLAGIYGHDFSTPAYVPGMGLIGRLRLGQVSAVEEQLEKYLSAGEIVVSNASLMAGQLVFAEFGRLSGDSRASDLVIQAANLGFDENGTMLESMLFHNEMSDSVFMAPPLLVHAGVFTGEDKYFNMAARHITFMQKLLLREDGLYRHSPLADVAWSRGNAFPALGLALVLSDFPPEHPAFSDLLNSYRDHLKSLIPHQNADGLWYQVVDYKGSFPELSSTAMIGIAIKRGLDKGWLDVASYRPVLDAIWRAVLVRTSLSGEFIDVCTSTGKMPTLEAYLNRPAILGLDDRAGGMIMNLAIEML